MPRKKLQQLETFMKVPNMNHCAADARWAFPVLLREPLGLEQAGQPEGGLSVSDGCTVPRGRYDLMLPFLPRSVGGLLLDFILPPISTVSW